MSQLSHPARAARLARVLKRQPGPLGAWLERKPGERAWSLCGCPGGDQPLAQTATATTAPEALDLAEAWLAPELAQLDRQPG